MALQWIDSETGDAVPTTAAKGVSAVMVVRAALHNLGYNTSRPEVDDGADLWALPPEGGPIQRMQVRSIIVRTDRQGEYVIPARRGNGDAFQPEDIDWLIGVHKGRAWMVPVEGKAEYWSGRNGNTARWHEITGGNAEGVVV